MPYRVTSAEFARLSSLYRYGILEAAAEPAVEVALRTLAARLEVPVAQLVLADARQFSVLDGTGEVGPVFPRTSGIVEEMVAGGPAFRSQADDVCGLPPGRATLRSFAGLRLTGLDDETLGVLYVADDRPRDLASAAAALGDTAAEVRAVLDSNRRAREDAGTGALLPTAFLEQARRLLAVSRMGGHWISLVVLDLGAFRATLASKAPGLNELLVHQLADLGRTQVRRRDSFGRLGSDVFALLLTDTGEAGARVLAQRLSRHVERGWAEAGLSAGLELGIASLRPSGAGDTIEGLMARATAAKGAASDHRPASRVA